MTGVAAAADDDLNKDGLIKDSMPDDGFPDDGLPDDFRHSVRAPRPAILSHVRSHASVSEGESLKCWP